MTKNKIPIGLQLFSVRGECSKNLPATLKEINQMGYVGVEPWGYGGESLEWMGYSCTELRQILDDNGLTCCGIHLSTQALLGDNLTRTIEFNQTLGNRFLIVAGDQSRMSSMDTIRELGVILDQAADQLADEEMFAGYHAHGFDFEKVSGETAWNHLFSLTKPEVIMQLDTRNCAGGGGDPVAVLEAFPHRARSVHLGEYGNPANSIIGSGEGDWEKIFHLCENNQNTEWYVVEQGGPDGFGFEIPRQCLDALREMGK